MKYEKLKNSNLNSFIAHLYKCDLDFDTLNFLPNERSKDYSLYENHLKNPYTETLVAINEDKVIAHLNILFQSKIKTRHAINISSAVDKEFHKKALLYNYSITFFKW